MNNFCYHKFDYALNVSNLFFEYFVNASQMKYVGSMSFRRLRIHIYIVGDPPDYMFIGVLSLYFNTPLYIYVYVLYIHMHTRIHIVGDAHLYLCSSVARIFEYLKL